MQTLIQYIRKPNYRLSRSGKAVVTENQTIGVMMAFSNEEGLKIGYSVLNPVDVTAAKEENVHIKKEISRIKAAWAAGDTSENWQLLKPKPLFDKVKAQDIAYDRATEKVDLNKAPAHVRAKLHSFIRRAAGWRYCQDHLV